MFIMNMGGCPAPNFNFLFSLPISSLTPHSMPTIPPPLPTGTAAIKSEPTTSLISPLSVEAEDESSSHAFSPRSATRALSVPHSPMEMLPGPIRSMSISHPMQAPIVTGNPRRRENVIATHYIQCCKCKKKRAVPMSRLN